ncbi:hypothetical protein PEC18_18555 [Paucibacter sp. O1-1]|nr:hypothetical protein [Paucibacter sp. O1-1]MDA3827799.1 hypothetical protein [Paucibacter sp. O1-1]
MNTHSVGAILEAASRACIFWFPSDDGDATVMRATAKQLRHFALELSSLEGLHHALLNPGPVVRDEMGQWWNDALPGTDEDVDHRSLLKAFRLELGYVDAEDQMTDAAYDALRDTDSIAAWEPTPPAGAGWVPLSIHDTEDGPVAWYVRPMPPRRELTRKERTDYQAVIDHAMDQAAVYAETVASSLGLKDKVAAVDAIDRKKAALRMLISDLVNELIDAKAVQQ